MIDNINFCEEKNVMKQINELSSMLKRYFNWNKVRMDCFAGSFKTQLNGFPIGR